jgi:alpha-tubulin suppressor-like RCC1 family protein
MRQTRLLSSLFLFAAILSAGPRVASYFRHGLKINPDRTVSAWGENLNGVLGDGTTLWRFQPVQVIGLTNVVAVATSYSHSLAVRADGTVWSWGSNNLYQLGDQGPSRLVAVQVPGLQNIVSVAASPAASLALRSDGTVWAWGYNSAGVLGTAVARDERSATPVQVVGVSDATSISAFYTHALAVRKDGSVLAWGYAGLDQMLYIVPRLNPPFGVPTVVPVVGPASAAAAGDNFSLVLQRDGTVWYWGSLDVGRASTPDDVPAIYSPRPIPDFTGVKGIAAGYRSAGFVKDDGSVWTLGTSPGNGGLTALKTVLPVRSLVQGPVDEVACGLNNVIALRPDGAALVWGMATTNGAAIPSFEPRPVLVPGFANSVTLRPAYYHTLSLSPSGVPSVAGLAYAASLGLGTGESALTPTPIPNVSGLVDIAASATANFALKADGTLLSWGIEPGLAAGGSQTTRNTPLPVDGLSGVKGISAGNGFALALRSDGTVWAWGDNQRGQVEPSSPDYRLRAAPIQVAGLPSGIISVTACQDYSAALRSDGTIWTWGKPPGTVVDDPLPLPHTPNQVNGISGAIKLGCYGVAGLALKADGTMWAWRTGFGFLGLDPDLYGKAVQFSYFSGVTDFASGAEHILVLRADGSVWGVGNNSSGQLGDGTTQPRTIPVPVTGLTGVKSLAAAWNRSFAILKNGTVFAWGDKSSGALGTGTSDELLVPTLQPAVTPLDLSVSVSPPANLRAGSSTTLTVTVTNASGFPSTGTSTLTLSPGPGLTVVGTPTGPWPCGANGQNITCGSAQTLSAYTSVSFTVTLAASAAAVPATTVTAAVSTPGDNNAANDSTTFALQVAPAPTGSAPSITAIGGLSGAASRRTFTFTVRDADGADNLHYLQFQVAKPQTETNSCLIHYDVAQNVFFLRNDDASDWWGIYPGTNTRTGNSQCELYAAATRAVKAGTDLNVTLDISFRGSFAGNRDVFILAADRGNNVIDWYPAGTITVSGDPTLLELLSVAPVAGAESSQLFTMILHDGDGAGKVWFSQLNINSANNAAQGCYVHYDPATNVFYLLSDNGLTWAGLRGGSNDQVQNSQCLLKGKNSTGTPNGQDLAITYDLQFKPSFAGAKNVYARASDLDGNLVQWKRTGTFQVR